MLRLVLKCNSQLRFHVDSICLVLVLNIDVATSLVEEWYSVCNICVASVVLKICYFD